ncbi:diguanylate cyclase [Thiomicrorhabdus sp. 6S3-12]|uniref:diguanylate cyclase n=1 Tax=Thiomicrorhabdus sp. 6S3-12 TaxID=2819681 RepID=UPI001AAD61D9|nr:diguanylate cyclase [Thiomicrorhabdus sp. 6S3-12]MBO1923939.1 diguanylate cyclase [Thiomicrorhabdus sp. 6S3-12]
MIPTGNRLAFFVVTLFWLLSLTFPFRAIAAADSPVPIKVLFNWHHQFEYAGFYAAQKKGFYKDVGLDVQLDAWNGHSIIDQVVNGDYQIGVDGSLILKDYINGKPIKILFPSLQYSPIVFLAHKPIDSLHDLAGKKLMFAHNYEIYALLNKAGLTADDIQQLPHSANVQDFIDKKVDFYSAFSTNEPAQLNEKNLTYSLIDPKSFGINSYGDFTFTSQDFASKHPDQLEAFKRATIRGWHYALENPMEIVDYVLQSYPVKKSRKALLYEANRTGEFVLNGKAPIGHLSSERLKALVYDMHSLGMVNETQLKQFDPDKLIFKPYHIHLTEEERTYLKENPVIRIANDIDWAPFEFIDSQGNYQGLAADYLRQLEKLLNIRFEPVQNLSWNQVIEKMQNGELDMFSCAVATDARKRYAKFTSPYLSFPMVALGKESLDYIQGIDQLNGQTIAVVKGYASFDYLQQHNPQIKILEVQDIEAGIRAVQEGQALAYFGNLAAISHKLKQLGDLNLKIAGQIGPRFELAMGANLENAILRDILQKALDAIPESEKSRIYNDWLQLRIVQEYDYSKLVLPFSVIGGIFLFTLILLGVQKRYQNKLQSYLGTINELNYASITDANQRMIWVSDSLCTLTGYSRKELINKPHKILMHQNSHELGIDPDKIWEYLKTGRTWSGELIAQKKNGEDLWVHATAVPEMSTLGRLRQVRTTRRDITAQKRLEEMTIRDELTGLYNRRHFNKVLYEKRHSQADIARSVSLVMMDIDKFKNLNDRYGHYYGDKVLQQLAERIKEYCHQLESAFAFRIGGEEFALIITGLSAQELRDSLEALRLSIEGLNIENQSTESERQIVTASIGAYPLPHDLDGLSEHTIYKRADKALYQAKKAGRNQVAIWSPQD